MKNASRFPCLILPFCVFFTGCEKDDDPVVRHPKARVMAPGSLEPLVEKAWGLMSAKKYDECASFIDAEFAKLEPKAREQEKGLRFFPDMKAGYKWHELDGAGNLLRVKQESLKRQGKLDEAAAVWELMFRDFPHFQSWRVPERTWRPAQEARGDWQTYTLLKAITDRKLDGYDYVGDSIFDHGVSGVIVTDAGRTLLEKEDFDSLEYACDFFATSPKWKTVSRSSFWDDLIKCGVSRADKPPDALWQKKKERLEKWMAAKPASVWAPVAMAEFWIEYAWDARGSGYADTVTQAAWQKFAERIKAAHATLDVAKRDCPLWYSTRLTVCMAESADATEIKNIFAEGTGKYPYHFPLYSHMQTILMPRWLGQPGDWQAFAKSVGKERGPVAYLNLCLLAIRYEGRETIAKDKEVDWPLMQEGFELRIKDNPKNIWLRNTYAGNAWTRKDKAAGKRAFELVDNVPHPYVWDTEEGFVDVKQWAEK